MKKNEYQEFFDSYAQEYDGCCFTSNTEFEVDFLIEELALQKGCSILDMGCGTGRHLIELAKHGYAMTGVDISSSMLEQARKAADRAGVEVELVQSCATKYISEERFDAAICLCEGAFGLLGTDDDPWEHDATILRNIHRSLKKGTQLVFNALNGLAAIRDATPEAIAQGGFDPIKLMKLNNEEYDTSEGAITMGGYERYYVPSELVLMCTSIGFEVEEVWGGTAGAWDKKPPLLDDIELMLIVKKE